MPKWLTTKFLPADPYSVIDMGTQLGIAFLCGCVIAIIFRLARSREQVQPTFPATLVLLTVLCAMLPLVIGENVAWAFGLVGALSLVRFRTVVEDTQDITFVIFSVLVGMAIGSEQISVALTSIVVAGGAALLLRPLTQSNTARTTPTQLTLRMGIERNPEAVLRDVFDQLLIKADFVSGGTKKSGTALALTYRIHLNRDTQEAELINRLNAIEGVQGVQLRK